MGGESGHRTATASVSAVLAGTVPDSTEKPCSYRYTPPTKRHCSGALAVTVRFSTHEQCRGYRTTQNAVAVTGWSIYTGGLNNSQVLTRERRFILSHRRDWEDSPFYYVPLSDSRPLTQSVWGVAESFRPEIERGTYTHRGSCRAVRVTAVRSVCRP
jgi:hypothetical protein